MTIVEQSDNEESDSQQNTAKNTENKLANNSQNIPANKEEHMIVIVDLISIFKKIQQYNLKSEEKRQITSQMFNIFPYFEVKGSENFKILQKKMIFRQYGYNKVIFSLNRQFNKYNEDISDKTMNISALNYIIIVLDGEICVQIYKRQREIKPREGRWLSTLDDPVSKKVCVLPVLSLGQNDFLTPSSLSELQQVSIVSKSNYTRLMFLRCSDYFHNFSVHPYMGLKKKRKNLPEDTNQSLEEYSLDQRYQIKFNQDRAIQTLKNNYKFQQEQVVGNIQGVNAFKVPLVDTNLFEVLLDYPIKTKNQEMTTYKLKNKKNHNNKAQTNFLSHLKKMNPHLETYTPKYNFKDNSQKSPLSNTGFNFLKKKVKGSNQNELSPNPNQYLDPINLQARVGSTPKSTFSNIQVRNKIHQEYSGNNWNFDHIQQSRLQSITQPDKESLNCSNRDSQMSYQKSKRKIKTIQSIKFQDDQPKSKKLDKSKNFIQNELWDNRVQSFQGNEKEFSVKETNKNDISPLKNIGRRIVDTKNKSIKKRPMLPNLNSRQTIHNENSLKISDSVVIDNTNINKSRQYIHNTPYTTNHANFSIQTQSQQV